MLVVLLILQPLRNVGQQSKQRPTLKTVGFLCCLSNLACLNFSNWQESSFMADFCKQVFHKPAVLNKPQDFLLKKVKIVQNGSIKRVQGCFFGSFHASWRSWQNTHWTTLGRANNSIPNVFEFITYLYETCPSHWDTQGLHHNGQHHRTHTHKHIVTLVAQMHCRHTKTQSQIFSYIIQIHKNAKLTYHYVLMSPAAL